MAKYKVAFVGEAEMLFAMMAKLLPIDSVTVEELAPRPAPVANQEALGTYVSKLTGRTYYKDKKRKRHAPKPMDLTKGINRIIMDELARGLARTPAELGRLIKEGGYSENSTGSRLNSLRDNGVVEQLGGGVWRLTERYLPQIAMNEVGQK